MRSMILTRALPAAALALLLAAAVGLVGASAASPASGTLSWSSPSVAWSGSGLAGTAPAFTRITCSVEVTACDDFALTVDTKKGGAVDHRAEVDVSLAPSAGQDMYLIVYPPGSSPADPTNTNYSKFGVHWRARDPQNGTWTVRAVCQACTGASYTATASIRDVAGDAVPAPGDQVFGWHSSQLATKDATGTDVPFGEPGIWFDSKGDGIVNTFGPTAWVTRDNGRHWSVPVNLGSQDTCTVESGDADAVVGGDGTFYLDNLCIGGVGGSSNDVFVNRKGGDPGQWSGPNFAGFNVDRPWLAPDPSHPGVVYISYHDLEGPNINVLKSADYGTTWTCPITGLPEHTCPITANATGTGYLDTGAGNTTARPLIDPTDTNRIYVPYDDNCLLNSEVTPANAADNNITRIHLAVSTDGGATWAADSTKDGSPALDANAAFGRPSCSTLPPSDPTACGNSVSHIFPTAAIDQAGNLYIVFSLRRCGQTETHLYLISSTDHGQTWSKPVQVDQGGIRSNVFEWVAAGSAGRLAITWYGSPAADFNDPSSQWSEMYAVSTDATSAHPTFLQSNISGSRSMHNGDICQAGLNCTVTGGNRDLADFQMVSIDSSGFAHAVWTDDSGGSGVTVSAFQTGGPKLIVSPSTSVSAAVTTPFTQGAGDLPAGAALGGGVAGAGVLMVLVAAGLERRRRTR